MKSRSPRKSPAKKLTKAGSQAQESPSRSAQQTSPRKPAVPKAGIAAYRKPSPRKKSPTKRPQTAASPTKKVASPVEVVESPTKRTTRAER